MTVHIYTSVLGLTVGALRLLRGCCRARGRNAWFSTRSSKDSYSADRSSLIVGATDDFCITVKFPVEFGMKKSGVIHVTIAVLNTHLSPFFFTSLLSTRQTVYHTTTVVAVLHRYVWGK